MHSSTATSEVETGRDEALAELGRAEAHARNVHEVAQIRARIARIRGVT